MKKLSVAVSCYNFEKYIEECITSILNQKTNFDFEIVIRDDFSNDGSVEIIKNLAEKYSGIRNIRLILDKNNLGPNRSIQNILENCYGEYIALIDGDDLLIDEFKLQRQVDFLDENPSFVMHSTSFKYLHADGRIEPEEEDLIVGGLKEIVTIEDLLDGNIISFGRMFRNIRSVFKNLSNQKYYIEIPYDDWGLNFEILKYGLAKCDKSLSGYYRITGNGVITGKSESEIHKQNDLCRDLLRDEYNKFKIMY
jgi:glycosyltransferase involved in cell wall biosynthesis